MEDVLRPKRDRLVAFLARERDALRHQPLPHAKTASGRLHQQQAKFGDIVRLAYEEYRSDARAVLFRDPAAFACWVEVLHEFGGNLRDQCLEPFVPAVFLKVELSVALDHPSDIARTMRSQREDGLAIRFQQALDAAHTLDQRLPFRARKPRD